MSARRLALGLFGLGVLLLAVGATVFFVFFPHGIDDVGWFGYGAERDHADWEMGWPESSGDLRLSMVGAAVAGVGFLVVLVPLIAWAVHLGRSLGDD